MGWVGYSFLKQLSFSSNRSKVHPSDQDSEMEDDRGPNHKQNTDDDQQMEY